MSSNVSVSERFQTRKVACYEPENTGTAVNQAAPQMKADTECFSPKYSEFEACRQALQYNSFSRDPLNPDGLVGAYADRH